MKHFPLSRLAILIPAIALLAGCTTTNTTQVIEVQPVSTGTMIGTVQLHEMDGTISASSAGVDVAILGANHHATTDTSGTFLFDSIPAGYYQFRFTKADFTSYVSNTPQEFVGADTLWLGLQAKLYRINNWEVLLPQSGLNITVTKADSVDTTFTLTFPFGSNVISVLDSSGNSFHVNGLPPTVAFFLGKSPNISVEDTGSYATWFYTDQYNSGYSTSFQKSRAGTDILYLVAYPISGYYPFYGYYLGQRIEYVYTGFGPPSNVLQIVLP